MVNSGLNIVWVAYIILSLIVQAICQIEYSHQIKLGLKLRRERNGRALGRNQFKFYVFEDLSVKAHGAEKESKVKAAVEESIDYWSKTLQPKNRVSKILLDRQCEGPGIWSERGCPAQYGCSNITRCGEVIVPANHLSACQLCDNKGCRTDGVSGEGISQVDYILYVSLVRSSLCQDSSTLAHASHCQQEGTLDRPVAGHINICPDNIDLTENGQVDLVEKIKHEILHTLGFSVQLYAFFRTGKGEPRTPRSDNGNPPLHRKYYLHIADDSTVKNIKRENWQVANGTVVKSVNMLVTPRVRREVRRHFKCKSLEGGELEDQGDFGTSFTHWEKRVFGAEAMTAIQQDAIIGGKVWRELSPISRITLAVLQDSGWYKVNFKMADKYTWGQGAGCTYAKSSCLQFMREGQRIPRTTEVKSSIAPFCNAKTPVKIKPEKERSLLINGKKCQIVVSNLFCNLIRYAVPLRPEYRNLDFLEDAENNGDVSNWGSRLSLADYCPTVLRMYSTDCQLAE